MSEIVKSEYNALGEDNNYKTHYFKTSADQVVGLGRLKNTEYQVSDVVYSDNNLSVALKCTQAGTSSETELDISDRAVGESVEDGSVIWEVVPRFLPAETINEIANELIEELFVGFIGTYAGNTPPTGWLDCSGASLNPQTYTRLFGRIGTIYGGNGSTTFNLPNMNNGSFAEGSNTAGTVKSAGLPNASGEVKFEGANDAGYWGGATGSYSALDSYGYRESYQLADNTTGKHNTHHTIALDLSKSNSLFGASDTVQPKSVTVKFCIKY